MIDRKLKQKVLDLDKHQCVRCGESEEDQHLLIHPIMPDDKEEPNDFVTLCNHCCQLVKTLKLQTFEQIVEWSDLGCVPQNRKLIYRLEWEIWGISDETQYFDVYQRGSKN